MSDTSGTWYDPSGAPRDPNAATDGADLYQGDTTLSGLVVVNGGGGDDTLHAGTGYVIMGGGEGNDRLFAGIEGGEYYGNEGDDTLTGSDVGEQLTGGAGNDVIDGGDGPDTMGLSGAPADYNWTSLPGGGWVVTDGVTGRDGSDTIQGIERIFYAATGEEADAPCFLEGTRIMTRAGEVPVERLQAGDLVLTLGPGGPRLAPIRWIGHRRLDLARHPRPEEAAPVRIRAGALGPNSPARDLYVSPDHALYLDGALVPAGLLVDGDAIERAAWLRRIRYFHVELDRHAVLLAEGAPAESYREDGNRADFDNGGLVVALHPAFAPAATRGAGRTPPCAPVVTEGPRLEAIRARLRAVDQLGRMRRIRMPISVKAMRR